jgi:Holliday junction resolvase
LALFFSSIHIRVLQIFFYPSAISLRTVGCMNRQYARGRAYEYKALTKLRDEGWLAQRSAASHSPIDIFAGKGAQTVLIQIKSGKAKVKEADRQVLREWAQAFNARAEIWHFRKRRAISIECVSP